MSSMDLSWPDAAPDEQALERAASGLRDGGAVGLPTEAGYVLASLEGRALPDGAPDGRRVVATVAADLDGLPRAPLLRRLAERFWPGPLVLEVETEHGWRALQHTAQRSTAALAERLRGSGVDLGWVAARSADGGLVCEAGPLSELHGSRLAAIGDGGRTRLDEPPAVLRIGAGRFELLEPGLLELEALRRTAGRRILFVCTGNTCRSPMAAALTRALLAKRLGTDRLDRFGFEVASAGVYASHGSRASDHAVTAVRELGADLSDHQSQPARVELVEGASEVYCLTRSHLQALRMALPPGRAEHVTLLDPDGRDVADPVGGSLEDYRACADQIGAALLARSVDWA